jgi:hypothetical protein
MYALRAVCDWNWLFCPELPIGDLDPVGTGDRKLTTVNWGEMGTGARGAPVPEAGLYVKIKRAQFRSPESRPNEGRVNSP